MRRWVPRGIRLRLVLAISAVSMAAVAASFFALHETTAANLRSRIDRELNEQYVEFQQRVLAPAGVTDPASLGRASDRFVAGQRYHPEARIYLISPVGLPPVTNQARIVNEELAESHVGNSESGEAGAGGIVSAGDGLTTISTDETGKLRVLTQPVIVNGARVGTFRVADPLTSVDQALAKHEPFVVIFATPKFCTSHQCGPTLDSIKPYVAKFPTVTFINVEPYKLKLVDGVLQADTDKSGALQATATTDEWHLVSEPVVYVVNGDGLVTARFDLIFSDAELTAALDAVK
jgi:hypothetical protein